MKPFSVNPQLRRHLTIAAALLVAIAGVESSAAAEPANAEPAAAETYPLGDPVFDGLDDFDAELEDRAGFPDPLETVNRQTLRFNQLFDRLLIDPIARAYRFVVPSQARRAFRQLLANLNAPATLVNDLLQREWRDGGITVTRFALNTTVGVAGLFDPARDLGYEPHTSDFGQTLALEGVASGPFLVLPALGPTTMRDGVGTLVDIMFRPTTYLLAGTDQIFHAALRGGSSGIATRDANAEAMRALEDSSIDYYAALRNAYYQHRTAEIWKRRAHHREDVETAALD